MQIIRPSFFFFGSCLFVLPIFSEEEIRVKIKLENGLNEFYFYFTNQNANFSPGAVTVGNLINLAAVEKTKRKNIIEL